jgi:hypothetical protein
MAWIKRNLYFVIGGAVALVLMGLAGWFLYSKWDLNNRILADLNRDYEELDKLYKQKPHPGAGPVDNIQAARDQRQQLTNFVQETRKFFQRIPPIPDLSKLTDQNFSAALSRTIDQLQRDAANASVTLPPGYNFSFEAEKRRVSFTQGSLEPLAGQLGEVKVICDALFQAKVNSLDSIQRERVSADDTAGPQTDYLLSKSTTNSLAVLTPYELTFRGFSSELAAVLASLASSPHCLIVKTINVESPQAGGGAGEAAGAMTGRAEVEEGMGRGIPGRTTPYAPPAYPAPMPPGVKGGLPTVLDERLLKITLALEVVKLLPPK